MVAKYAYWQQECKQFSLVRLHQNYQPNCLTVAVIEKNLYFSFGEMPSRLWLIDANLQMHRPTFHPKEALFKPNLADYAILHQTKTTLRTFEK